MTSQRSKGIDVLKRTEIDALEQRRLQRKWTYRELADDISRAFGIRLPEPTLIRALRPGARLRATTVYPIRQYLARKQSGASAF